MSETDVKPYLGEIRLFAGDYAPVGWLRCDGQAQPIRSYPDLFSVIRTTYGGDGQNTFCTPDLRGRVPIGSDLLFPLATAGGEHEVTLSHLHMPQHTHPLMASTADGTHSDPLGRVLAESKDGNIYRPGPAAAEFEAWAVTPAGGQQPHDNHQPYVCVTYIIAHAGDLPEE